MTACQRAGKKRFRALQDGSVWETANDGLILNRLCAVFNGENRITFARSHAKMLNALKREEQP